MGRLTHTVNGDVASFRAASRVPLESLKFHFLPKQEGSGDASLTNIRPITGWTGLNGWKSSKNLLPNNIVSGTEYSQGLKFVQNADGSITITGTATNTTTKLAIIKNYTNGSFPLKAGKYRPHVWSTEVNTYLYMSIMYNNGNSSMYGDAKGNSYAYTLSEDTYITQIRIGIQAAEGVKFNLTIYPSLEIGSVESTWEDCKGEPIPITFPISDSNLFSYDEDKFSLEDCVNSSESVLRRQVYHTGLTNGVFTLTAQIKEGYTRPSYNLFNIGICENGVNTIINTFIGTTEYIRGNYINSNQELIIISTTESLNTADTTIKRYDIEIKNDAFYGGYVDALLGEIVLTHAKTFVMWGEDGTDLGTVKRRSYTLPFTYKTGQELHDNGQGEYKKMTLCDKAKWKLDYTADVEHYYIHGKNAYIYLDKSTPNDTKIELCAMLAEPFHIAITPQQLQAFLDHNNFWSDANDVTEVTYPVTESKDILATRKKAMVFDHAHHKKVKWNQVVRDGNFTGEKVDASKWATSRSDTGTLSISDNTATWTCVGVPSWYYQTGITWSGGAVSSYNYLAIPWNHLILVKCKVRCTIPCKVRLFALVGSGAHVWAYNETIEANAWTDIVGFIPNRNEVPTGEDDGFIKRFKPCITGINNISEVVVGTEFKIKELMAFDLTQMFGLGNEPQTVAEFERICAINGIDLTTYWI